MNLKLLCHIKDYTEWDHLIYNYAQKFYKKYSIYPNLLLAKTTTFIKIEEYVNLNNPENILKETNYIEEVKPEEDFKSISSFVTTDFSIEFCLDEKIKENYILMIFDEDPIFDGEPYEETFDKILYKKIA